MEPRKIIIVDTNGNHSVTITTGAETFGELKTAAREAGINYEGKEWLEGLTQTRPVSDDSLLPTNVNYKGKVTNNLVYGLTNTQKNIKSGLSRGEMYDYIRCNNLQAAVKNEYGCNYTNLSNEALERFINNQSTEEPDYKELYEKLGTIVVDFFNKIAEEGFIGEANEDVEFSKEDIKKMFNLKY